MMINVVCMLLLKIGWPDTVTSLRDIGLDQWWMGLIAFIFGAKAMQAFFESKMTAAQLALEEKEGNGARSCNRGCQ
jgi:hypothetical protein